MGRTTRRTAAMTLLAALAAAPSATPVTALPGNYSIEAYAPGGARRFAGRFSYFNRIWSARQYRHLDAPTRADLVHRRVACHLRVRLSDHDLRAIAAHWRAGHHLLVKRYLGYRAGRRHFATVCALTPATLRRTQTGGHMPVAKEPDIQRQSAPVPARVTFRNGQAVRQVLPDRDAGAGTRFIVFRNGRPVAEAVPEPAPPPPPVFRRFVVFRDGRPVAE